MKTRREKFKRNCPMGRQERDDKKAEEKSRFACLFVQLGSIKCAVKIIKARLVGLKIVIFPA